MKTKKTNNHRPNRATLEALVRKHGIKTRRVDNSTGLQTGWSAIHGPSCTSTETYNGFVIPAHNPKAFAWGGTKTEAINNLCDQMKLK